MVDIRLGKQIEEDLKIKKRKKDSALWRLFYKGDEFVGNFGNKKVKGKEKKVAILGGVFAILDIVTTTIFLHYNLGIEGNYLPARFYEAGLKNEFEIMKLLAVTFIIGFNYMCATRGFTKKEREVGRIGLFITFAVFLMMVIWNIFMMITSLIYN